MIDSRYNHRTFADKFNEWTGQPVFWAAIASLGLHGILFAALPSFSSSTTDLDDRTVSVVELGAEELSRLPSFPELETPNLPNVDDPYDLDPLENWDQVLKDLGIDDQEPTIPTSPGIVNPPLPRSPVRTSSPSPLTPPLFDFTRPGRVVIPRSSTPTPAPSPSSTPGPSSTPTPSPSSTPAPPTSQGLQAANPLDIGDEVQVPPADGPVDSGNDTNEPPDQTIEPTPQPLEADLVARLLSENQQRQKAIAYLNGVQQNNELFNKWNDQPAASNNFLDSPAEFPLDACLAGQDASVQVGVLVGRNNQPISNKNFPNPVYIQLSAQEFLSLDGESAGADFDPDAYSLLDETALDVIQNHPYEAENGAGTRRRYFHTITFDYDEAACAAHLAEQQAESAGATGPESGDEGTVNPPGDSDSGDRDSGDRDSASNGTGGSSATNSGGSDTPGAPSEISPDDAPDPPVTPPDDSPGEPLPEEGTSEGRADGPDETTSSGNSAPGVSTSASDLD